MLVALSATRSVSAQMVITPSLLQNVHTAPGFIALDDVARERHVGFGVTVSHLTHRWLGVEAEATVTPSAFSGGDLVISSRLFTLGGSVLALAPERWPLRPFISVGIGVAQIKSIDVASIFAVQSWRALAMAGIGTWVWWGPRVGIRGGIRFLRSFDAAEFEAFETWQPSVGMAIRF